MPPYYPRPTPALITRLLAKIQQGPPDQCWPWQGALSTSRSISYGAIQEGGRGSKIWRAHVLMLLIWDAPEDTYGAELLRWVYLRWRQQLAAGREVSHRCDWTLCCNPHHLAWETHQENLDGQRARRRRREEAA